MKLYACFAASSKTERDATTVRKEPKAAPTPAHSGGVPAFNTRSQTAARRTMLQAYNEQMGAVLTPCALKSLMDPLGRQPTQNSTSAGDTTKSF